MRTEAKDVVTPYLIHMKCKCVCFLKKNSNENYLFLALSSSFLAPNKRKMCCFVEVNCHLPMYNLKNWLWFCYTTIYSVWHMIKIYDLFVLNDGHCEGHQSPFPIWQNDLTPLLLPIEKRLKCHEHLNLDYYGIIFFFQL